MTDADYVSFADDLIVGQGQFIVQAWKALAGEDPSAKREMAEKLDLRLVLVLIWMVLHRFVLNWYKHYLGLP